MKAYVAATLARQVKGEYVFLDLHCAFHEKHSAENYMKSRSSEPLIQIAQVHCIAERSILEVELSEDASNAKKLFAAICMARQVDGEYVFVKVERASTERSVIEQFQHDLLKFESLTIEGIQCVAERSVLEVEFE